MGYVEKGSYVCKVSSQFRLIRSLNKFLFFECRKDEMVTARSNGINPPYLREERFSLKSETAFQENTHTN